MSQTLTNLIYHIVFSTKNHCVLITDDIKSELHAYIGGIVRGEKGTFIAVGGTEDHIHILAKIPPSISLSEMLQRIKGNSSKWLHETKKKDFSWQRGYGAFSVSESVSEKVQEYIQRQVEHHKKMSFKEEFLGFLRKHNIEYSEKYLWD